MDKISLIVPCYNEEEVLPILYDEVNAVTRVMKEQEFELLFVDDGSKDNTLDILKQLHEKDERVKIISFSRNFGKEAAIYAGLQNAAGDYVALIDADLQDPPKLIPEMYSAIKNDGFDCVATRRATREGEPPIRSLFARAFYKLMNKMSKTETVDGARDFRLMSRKVVDAVLSMGEYNRFSKGIFGWVGFKTKWISYENIERAAGTTKWSFWKLLIYALDGILAFSTVPLIISSFVGLLFCFVAFVMIIAIIVKTSVVGESVAGYPSMVCIMFFIGGVQLFCFGILGQYMSKMYMEGKKRPIYIVAYTEKDAE